MVPTESAELVTNAFLQAAMHRVDTLAREAKKRARRNWIRLVQKVILRNRVRRDWVDAGDEVGSVRVVERADEAVAERKVVRRKRKEEGGEDNVEMQDAGGEEYGLEDSGRRRRPRHVVATSSDEDEAKPPIKRVPKTLGGSDDEDESSSDSDDDEKQKKAPKPRRLADSSSSEDESSDHAEMRIEPMRKKKETRTMNGKVLEEGFWSSEVSINDTPELGHGHSFVGGFFVMRIFDGYHDETLMDSF